MINPMNGPTSRMGSRVQTKYINVTVKMSENGIIIKSGGSTFQLRYGEGEVLVTPKSFKDLYGSWDESVRKYVVLLSYGEVVYASDDTPPSELPLVVKYKGNATRRFIELAQKLLMRYYRGQSSVLRLPLSDKNVYRFAVCLMRMSSLQSISDVV
jgi:hypothetical protein